LCFEGKISNLAFACFDFDHSNIGFAIVPTMEDALQPIQLQDNIGFT
jgi:hypothetical protein